METIKQVQIMEPASHSDYRTEYEIPRGVYASNVRLANFGVGSSKNANLKYSSANGVYSCIKNIFLYDDFELVNSCYNVHKLSAMFNINHRNSQNLTKYSYMNRNNLNFINENDAYKNVDPVMADNHHLSLISLNQFLPFFSAMDSSTHHEFVKISKDSRMTHHEKSRKINKLLKSQSVIRFDLFKRPRLIVEYNYDVPYSQLFINGTDADEIHFNSPSLIMDKIMDESLFDKSAQLKYFEYGHDVYNIDDVPNNPNPATYIQNVNVRIRGCENKYLHKVFVMKTATTDTMKGDCSVACKDEQINFKVNNILLFSENLDTPAKLSYVACNSLGDITQVYGGNKTNGLVFNGQLATSYEGLMSYFVAEVNEYIESLYFIFQRTLDNVTPRSGPLQVYFFYLTDKTMVSNGSNTEFLNQ